MAMSRQRNATVLGVSWLLLAAPVCLRLFAGEPETPRAAALAAPERATFWPAAPEKPRIQFLTTLKMPSDITGNLGNDARPQDRPPMFLERPYGVRMADGKIYVCQSTVGTVAILDVRGRAVDAIHPDGDQALQKPIDIALGADGRKYVADTGRGAVMVFDKGNRFVAKFMVKGMRPVALAIQGDELFVNDMGASKIRVLDCKSGAEVRTLAPATDDKPVMGGPMGLALDGNGAAYVTDVISCVLRKFTADGKQAWAVGGVGTEPGKFVRPKHIACDADGVLYVVDNATQTVQLFDKKGELLLFFGGPGKQAGHMDMPTGICVSSDPKDLALFAPHVHPAFDAKQLIVVSNNFGNDKISIYARGELKAGKTVADLPAPAGAGER